MDPLLSIALRRRSLLRLGLTAGTLLAGLGPLNRSVASPSQGARPPLPPPAPLRSGSRLRLINPGTWLEPDAGLELLQRRCAAEGWELEVPASVYGQWRYFSGRDQERRDALAAAWADPAIDGLVTLAGGWGSARVLEAGFRFPPRSKWTLGFSDTSALLLAQWSAGLTGGVHGTCGGSESQWTRTVDLLSGRSVGPLEGRGVRPGQARGPLVVTNLTVATHLVGTPWFPDLRGAILVLEDVGEAPYRVDRMLTQWRSAGLLQDLAGVACGRFSWAMDDILPGDFTMEEILVERLGDLGIPLVLGLPVGHGGPNQALPLGSSAWLDGARGRLMLVQ